MLSGYQPGNIGDSSNSFPKKKGKGNEGGNCPILRTVAGLIWIPWSVAVIAGLIALRMLDERAWGSWIYLAAAFLLCSAAGFLEDRQVCFWVGSILLAGVVLTNRSKFGVAVFLFLIAKLSTPSGGADGWHQALMDWFGWSADVAREAVHWIRKTIHFTFYGLAGVSLAFAAKWRVDSRRLWLACVIWVAGLGAYDEIRQAQFANRQGRPGDWMIDVLGAMCLVALYLKLRRRPHHAV